MVARAKLVCERDAVKQLTKELSVVKMAFASCETELQASRT